jgi:hypothetical protein
MASKALTATVLASASTVCVAQSHEAGSDADLAEKLANPVAAMIACRFRKQPVSFAGGVGYSAEHSDTGAKEWRLRFVVTLLFPQ